MERLTQPNPKTRHPLTIVLTGGIASGKTTVSDLFAQLGVPIIDTDQISREMVEPGKPALSKIVKEFGSEILLPNGQLNRAAMRDIIFSDLQAKSNLEEILHPGIAELVFTRVEKVTASYCILVIPLYFESNSYSWVDYVLVVDVPEPVQLARVMKRDQIDKKQAEAILTHQASRDERLSIADFVLENDLELKDLRKQVVNLHKYFLKLASGKTRSADSK